MGEDSSGTQVLGDLTYNISLLGALGWNNRLKKEQ
jgi:hypothetical protein